MRQKMQLPPKESNRKGIIAESDPLNELLQT